LRLVTIFGTTFAFVVSGSASGLAAETILYAFQGGSDGAGPTSALIADANGALYGTTPGGGDLSCSSNQVAAGCGVVYKLTPSPSGGYVESVLHAFHGAEDGAVPYGALVMDAAGNLYGTTYDGGNKPCVMAGVGCGTVFELSPSGRGYSETILYRFQGTGDGANPSAQLALAASGTLYGTTDFGAGRCAGSAAYCSTLFSLTPGNSGYTESVLDVFGIAGLAPTLSTSGLVEDASGAFYGTDYGAENSGPPYGSIVYKVPPGAGPVTLRASTGNLQFTGGVVEDASGALYGETYLGGKACSKAGGCGTVFKLSPAGAVVYQYEFRGIKKDKSSGDGSRPSGGLLLGPGGILYGTTITGGATGCELFSGSTGCGTVFALTPSRNGYSERILHSFSVDGGDGIYPKSSLIVGSGGLLYGTTSAGGNGYGTVYEIAP
jgi:uncharacterized repeat protein (TIGR03803 family)